MLGFEKDPTKGENIRDVEMSADETAAVKTAEPEGLTAFASYYTCSLKDMGSCNIAATRLGLPIWEVSAQLPMVRELFEKAQFDKKTISDAAKVVGQLLKMVTDEVTMERGDILIA
eukprot:scaffold101630_cov63-Phaeocystis_antarctica.AAC.3